MTNSLGKHDGPELFDRGLEFGVYENIVIIAEVLNLPAGLLKSSFDNCTVDVVRLVTTFEPCFQLLTRWRENENTYGAGNFCLKLRGALYIDVEDEVAATRKCVLDEVFGGSVTLAEDFGVLEEFAGDDHLVEFLAGNEEVFSSGLFATARIASGVGDGELKAGYDLAELVGKR